LLVAGCWLLVAGCWLLVADKLEVGKWRVEEVLLPGGVRSIDMVQGLGLGF